MTTEKVEIAVKRAAGKVCTVLHPATAIALLRECGRSLRAPLL